jgi:UDPglucose--hexose-1-phosphate uridylyltransferase
MSSSKPWTVYHKKSTSLQWDFDEELKAIGAILKGEKAYDEKELLQDEILGKHLPWIKAMVGIYGTDNEDRRVVELLKEETGNIFLHVLEDAGVFKRDLKGQKLFVEYMQEAGFKETGKNF